MTLPRTIGIYGTGRVARALLSALSEKGSYSLELIGRDPEQLTELGERFAIRKRNLPHEADPELDLLLVAIKDDAIPKAVNELPEMQGVMAHCSGVLPLSVLHEKGRGQGVFYPIQSFSSEGTVDWQKIPICIEGSDEETRSLLEGFAHDLSDTVKELSGEERKLLHLAAVFACNFTNHLYSIAEQLLEERGIPYELLSALILHTAQKGVEEDPRKVQTGPAARGDEATLNEHLGMLEDKEELKALYHRLSRRIMEEEHGKSEF